MYEYGKKTLLSAEPPHLILGYPWVKSCQSY